jgi:Na+-driven multidrug efflux pump
MIGMSSAVETLGSQFNGAKAYKEVGVTLWKCIMILGLMLPFIAVTWYFTGEIFKALGNPLNQMTIHYIDWLLSIFVHFAPHSNLRNVQV